MPFSSLLRLDSEHPILVFGSEGQVGLAVRECLKNLSVPAVFLGRAECDLSDESALLDVLHRYQPQIIINAAAYTAVDRAESETTLAHAINGRVPGIMASYLANVARGTLLHFSTDYVYPGSLDRPYLETDSTGPLSEYGKSKLAGEVAIQEAFANCAQSLDNPSRYFILRTSWVYGQGNNFIRTMLRLARERDELKVVADQYGVPSSATWLAQIALTLVASRVLGGVYHAVPDGVTTWHGLAVFAIETAAQYGEGVELRSENILPIPTEAYPLPAPRPKNSRMNNHKLKQALSQMAYTHPYPRWEEEVEAYVKREVQASLGH